MENAITDGKTVTMPFDEYQTLVQDAKYPFKLKFAVPQSKSFVKTFFVEYKEDINVIKDLVTINAEDNSVFQTLREENADLVILNSMLTSDVNNLLAKVEDTRSIWGFIKHDTLFGNLLKR